MIAQGAVQSGSGALVKQLHQAGLVPLLSPLQVVETIALRSQFARLLDLAGWAL